MQTLYKLMDLPFPLKILLFWGPLLILIFDWHENEYVSIQLSNAQKRSELKNKKLKIKEIREFFNNNKESTNEPQYASEEIKVIMDRISPEKNSAHLLTELSKYSETTGTEILKIQPLSSEQFDELKADSIQIELKGTYSQLLGFISNLSEYEKLVNIKSYEFSKIENSSTQLLQGKLILQYFYLYNKISEAVP